MNSRGFDQVSSDQESDQMLMFQRGVPGIASVEKLVFY